MTELQKLQEEYRIKREELSAIREKINLELLKGIDYTGKVITIPTYGTMFVTWQAYHEKDQIYGDSRMFFQGMTLSTDTGPYRDDNWVDCSGLDEWYIPYETFMRNYNSGEIEEMSIEDFEKKIYASLEAFKNQVPELIADCKAYVERKSK